MAADEKINNGNFPQMHCPTPYIYYPCPVS